MRNIVPGFVWLQATNGRWFLSKITEFHVVADGSDAGTAKVHYRDKSSSMVSHTVEQVGEAITESYCAEIRMREWVQNQARKQG